MRPQAEEFEELIAQYERRIFNVVYRMVDDYDEAADLVQETFIRAYKAYDRFRGDSQPYTWFYRIAVNVTRDHLAKRQRESSKLTSLDVSDGNGESRSIELPDERYTPNAQVEQQELREEIEKAINELPLGYRECVLLREMEEMSYEQIAHAMSISVEAVRSRLARARAYLRQRLGSYLKADIGGNE